MRVRLRAFFDSLTSPDRRIRDDWIIFGLALATFVVAAALDLFETFHGFAAKHDDWQLDELFILFIVLSIAGLVYAIRRLRELTTEMEARRAAEKEAHQLAFHDPLTGLANRRSFIARLTEVLEECSDESRAALLMLDLDGFKSLNDVFGHATGDEALNVFAERVSEVVPKGAMLARVGGDEFAILLPRIASLAEPAALSRRIIATLAKPLPFKGPMALGTGIGIAIAPNDGSDADAIMRRADIALYRAKAHGRGQIRFFETAMDQHVERRSQIERELFDALSRNEIEVYYQPLVRLDGRSLIGFEALARWTSPTLGPISPVEFIAVAEECGLISELGDNLLRTACRQAVLWPDDLVLAFNISPLQLRNSSLGLHIVGILAETGLNPRRLELEITESALVRDAELAQQIVDELRAAGVRIALDDFGTGYATMSQLLALRFDKIKIDQSFVQRLGKDAQSEVIVRATVGLARGLGLKATAEGIEEMGQFEALKATGCQEGQGYLFGKAIPASEIPALLDGRTRPVAAVA